MAKQAKTTGTALTKWDEKFAGLAKEAAKGFELPAAKFISCKSGVMSYGGAKMPNNEIFGIIVGAVLENQYYDPKIKYDPDEPQVPICFAFAAEGNKADMAPPDEALTPQSEACATCPHNEFGSADQGNGKACKNVLRLALIPYDVEEDISKAEVVYLKVPVMSVRNWSYYVNKVLKPLNRPYWAVSTRVALEPDDKSQHRVIFELGEKIEDVKLFQPLEELWGKTMDGIAFPYVAVERKAKPAAPKAGKFGKAKR